MTWKTFGYPVNMPWIYKGFHGLSIHNVPRSVSNGGIARRVRHEKKNENELWKLH